MQFTTDRRSALASIGAGLVMTGLAQAAPGAPETTLAPSNGENLKTFSRNLAQIERRRDFKTVPMIPDKPDLWDARPSTP